jgi:hypothetical protein
MTELSNELSPEGKELIRLFLTRTKELADASKALARAKDQLEAAQARLATVDKALRESAPSDALRLTMLMDSQSCFIVTVGRTAIGVEVLPLLSFEQRI